MTGTPAPGPRQSLSRQQLVLHARELGRHFQKERELQRTLVERERQVREMAGAYLAAQEEERQSIALEVHDRLAQTLAAAFQQLQALESTPLWKPRARKMLTRARTLLREAIRESRNIMNELYPPGLEELGVVPLIEEELRRFQEDTGCRARFDAGYPVRPSREVEVALYRVFHEALTNVRRHAPGAQNVSVTLAQRDGVVRLEVRDDGPGFDVPAATANPRVGGLMSMRRRAEVVGGTFAVTSGPGQGTTVAVSMSGGDLVPKKDGGP